MKTKTTKRKLSSLPKFVENRRELQRLPHGTIVALAGHRETRGVRTSEKHTRFARENKGSASYWLSGMKGGTPSGIYWDMYVESIPKLRVVGRVEACRVKNYGDVYALPNGSVTVGCHHLSASDVEKILEARRRAMRKAGGR